MRTKIRWPVLIIAAATALFTTALWLALAPAGAAQAAIPPPKAVEAGVASGPGEPGNLLDYADSDFEGASGTGDWTGVSNALLVQSDRQAYLHEDSLADLIFRPGTSVFQVSSAVRADVASGAAYTVGGYFLVPAAGGQTVTWGLSFYAASGASLGTVNAPAVSLNDSGGWQYAAGTMTAPAGAAYVAGSPIVSYSGANSHEVIYLDEVSFSPHRAAQMIGAYAPTAAAWQKADNTSQLGPLQSNKEFFSGPLPAAQGSESPFQQTRCYALEQLITPPYPACIIAYKAQETQAAIDAFVQSVPADQLVILVYWQEPEGAGAESFSACGTTGGPAFVCEFGQQAAEIRAAGDDPNVLVGMDAEGYQYSSAAQHDRGTGCAFVPPAADVDVYLEDHYEGYPSGNDPPSGDAMPQSGTPFEQEWSNWLACVSPTGKPVGLAEYGLNHMIAPAVVDGALQADDGYLAGLPGGGLNAPVLVWEYWWCGGDKFGSSGSTALWRSFETQNGGG